MDLKMIDERKTNSRLETERYKFRKKFKKFRVRQEQQKIKKHHQDVEEACRRAEEDQDEDL
jgi:hypothetical protein